MSKAKKDKLSKAFTIETADKEKAHFSLSKHLLNFGILYLLLLLCLITSLLTDKFLTTTNIINIIRQGSTVIILSLGMGIVIITGGIDLSVGALSALSAIIVSGALANWKFSIPLAIGCSLLVGLLFGLFNGIIVARFRISPMIVTLASLNAARGIALLYNDGAQIVGLPDAFTQIGRGYIAFIPVPVIIMLVLVAIVYFVMTYTVFGKYLYAIGGNEEVARLAGISVKKIKAAAYSICGIGAALVGVIYAARLNMGDPTMGSGLELDAISSAVLGGINLYGGQGKILGAVIGALLISVLSNSLNLIGISSFWQLVVKAAVLVGAALIYTRKNV